MSVISRDIEIGAPLDAVWELLEDVRRLPDYSPSTREVRDAPERLTQVGQTYVQVGRLLGRDMTSRWRVVELERGRRIRSEGSLAPGVRYVLTQLLEEAGEGRTRLRVEVDYSLPGGVLGRLASKAGVESLVAKETETVLEGVRRVAEDDAG